MLQLDHVTKTVVKLVNLIRARGLNHRQFIQLLEESGAEHMDVLYHSNARWLSLGKVLHRVWELRGEIMTFLGNVGKADEFTELQDLDWMCDFAFGVDVLSHLNDLNVKLQGKNAFVHELYSHVTAFKAKLILFSRQMSNKSFTHFPTLATLNVPPGHTDRYSTTLTHLHTEFNRRFADFEKIEPELELVSTPFSFHSEKAPPDVQLELIDIQCDPSLKEKFSTSTLDSFYGSLNETQFPNLRRHARRMLVLFGSTYVCEQTFSVMNYNNYNKSRYRSRLTDEHLSSVLPIATTQMTPDFDELAKGGDRLHCSH